MKNNKESEKYKNEGTHRAANVQPNIKYYKSEM